MYIYTYKHHLVQGSETFRLSQLAVERHGAEAERGWIRHSPNLTLSLPKPYIYTYI